MDRAYIKHVFHMCTYITFPYGHLQHATYWPHIQSSRRFAYRPHSRELPDEMNASHIVVKSNYLYLFHELHGKHSGIQAQKK